jgi:hypothetical protein
MAYDVEMIGDFIDQLTWDLRADYFEFTAGPNAHNPELVEQGKKNVQRWRVLRLLSLFALEKDRPELTGPQMSEAIRQFGATMARKREEQLLHLEALRELFNEACAHAGGTRIEIKVPASKVLDGTFWG